MMKKNFFLFTWLFVSLSLFATVVPNAALKNNKYKSGVYGVRIKPATSGSFESSYTLTHNKSQFAHEGNTSQVPFWADDYFTTFSTNENTQVEISLLSGNITSFEARPSTNISNVSIAGGKLTFTIASDKYVTFIINGDAKKPVHIFSDPLETKIPSKTCSDVFIVKDGSTSINSPLTLAQVGNATTIYFEEGGIHYVGVGFKITDDNTGNRLNGNRIKEIYIPNGALVVGSIRAVRVSDMKIHGRGVICGQEGYTYRTGGNYTTDRIYNSAICMVDYGGTTSKNQTVEGITSMWALKYHLLTASGSTVQNVKCFDFHETTDGVGTGRNSVVRNSFFKVNDDVVKLYDNNIFCENLYVWHQTNGAVFQFGWGDAQGQNCTVNNTYLLADDSYYSKGTGWWSNHSIINWMHSNNTSRLHKDHIIDGINMQGMPEIPVWKLVGINLDCSEGCGGSASVGGDMTNLQLKNIKIGAQKTISYAGVNKSGSDVSMSLCNVKSSGANVTIEKRQANDGAVTVSTSNTACGTPGSSTGFSAWVGGNGGGCPVTSTNSTPKDPVITITAPVQDETISGSFTVKVNTYDEDFGTTQGAGISSVMYQIFDINNPAVSLLTPTVSSAPFSWNLNTIDFPNGQYEIRAGVLSQDMTTRKWSVLKPITISNNVITPIVTSTLKTYDYPVESGQAFNSTMYDVFVKQGNNPEKKVRVLMSDVNYRTMYDGDWMKAENKDRTFSFAQMDFDPSGGDLTIRVVKKFGYGSTSAVLSPKSYGYLPTFTKSNELTFKVNANSKYISVNFQGTDNETPTKKWIKNMLCIFVDPMETDKPSKTGTGVVVYSKGISGSTLANASIIYFPAGYHNLRDYTGTSPIDADGALTLKSNQSIYLEGGAFVEGIIKRTAYGDVNQRVFGRGILTGRQYYWHNHPNYTGPIDYGQLIELGNNAEVKGIMYMESPNHGVVGRTVHVENVKFLGWHSNHDGIRVGADSEIENSFLRAVDDHFYNFNIWVHDCVLWAGHNGSIMTYGWGGEANSNNYPSGSSVMENIDIINPEWTGLGNNNGLIMAQVGYNHPISDYGTGDAKTILRNIRVEGSIPGITNLKPRSNGATNTAVQVTTANVSYLGNLLMENISVEAVYGKGVIRGEVNPDFDGNKKWLVKDCEFKNITIGGVCVNETNKADYFTIDANTIQNVTFNCVETYDISDLRATLKGCNTVELKWTNVSGSDAYRIRRRLASETTYTILADVTANTTLYNDNTIQDGKEYVYMVRAMSGGAAVGISNTPSIIAPVCTVTTVFESNIVNSINVYPNPVERILYLTEEASWEIFTPIGEKVLEGKSSEIEMDSFKSGVYLIKLKDNIFKVVKH